MDAFVTATHRVDACVSAAARAGRVGLTGRAGQLRDTYCYQLRFLTKLDSCHHGEDLTGDGDQP